MLDKAIKHGKEKRKPYRRGKAVCKSCRNHGGCPVCEGNRLNRDRSKAQAAREELIAFLTEEPT